MVKQVSLMSHTFSVEINSKIHLRKLSISDEPTEVLIEGDFGKNIHLEVVEGIMLQISGENCTFRLDITESEAECIGSLLSLK
jgi:hypothetical protein